MDRYTIDGRPRAALHHLPAARDARPRAHVLFVHGTTFPTKLAAGWRFACGSWMDRVSEGGFDAWGLDFAGHGDAERYPQQRPGAPADGDPIERASDDAEQIRRAVELIVEVTGETSVALVAHSRGTMPAARFATQAPRRVAALVLFAPIVARGESGELHRLAPTFDVSAEWQWQRFAADVPAGEEVFPRADFERWAEAYLATDAHAGDRDPPSVRVPAGPLADILAATAGRLPYDPAAIEAPTLVVHGEWDSLCTDADAEWLLARLTAARAKARVAIPRATHVAHLEHGRADLHRAVDEFLSRHAAATRP